MQWVLNPICSPTDVFWWSLGQRDMIKTPCTNCFPRGSANLHSHQQLNPLCLLPELVRSMKWNDVLLTKERPFTTWAATPPHQGAPSENLPHGGESALIGVQVRWPISHPKHRHSKVTHSLYKYWVSTMALGIEQWIKQWSLCSF